MPEPIITKFGMKTILYDTLSVSYLTPPFGNIKIMAAQILVVEAISLILSKY
jgi:hypothetical protein